MKYELETKNRYRSETVAESYKVGYTKGYSFRILKISLLLARKSNHESYHLLYGCSKNYRYTLRNRKMTIIV